MGQHDKRLEKVLDRAQQINLTLSADKCLFRGREITYLGENLKQDGLRWPEPIYMSAGYVFESHFSAGKG